MKIKSSFIKLIFTLQLCINESYRLLPEIPNKYISYSSVRKVLYEIYHLDSSCDHTIEHIVPQSKFKNCKELKRDMHNLIFYPSKINLHRSNYKYISDFKFFEKSILLDEEGKEIKYICPLRNASENICIKTAKRKYFLPSEKYRGAIARATMYFLITYPEYKDEILKEVIDPFTILTWHHEYPVSEFEIIKNKKVLEQQGNNNIFVTHPELLVEYMEEILHTDLDLYDEYKYF